MQLRVYQEVLTLGTLFLILQKILLKFIMDLVGLLEVMDMKFKFL